jgi:hypothetical protein
MLDRERRHERQIEFPPEQRHHRLVTPVLLGVAVLCAIIVIIVVSTDANGPFLGPW